MLRLKRFSKYAVVFLILLSTFSGCDGEAIGISQKEASPQELATWIPKMESSSLNKKERGEYTLNQGVLSQKLITNGENMDGWMVYDNSPEGATIKRVSDSEKGDVLKFSGDGVNNGYVVGYSFATGSTWNDVSNKTIKWSMKYDEDFIIYVRITTTDGYRYLYYTNSSSDYGEVDYNKPHYIHNGLGATANDGTWRTFTRNLSADLKRHQPDNEIISVDGFFIRGSGYIDDIERLSPNIDHPINTVVYEDAQDGEKSRWSIYTHGYTGSVTNIYDDVKSSRVIELNGEATQTGYLLGSWSSEKGWKNSSNKEISWEMNYCENFVVYISVESEQGHRFMTYSPLSKETFVSDPNYGEGKKIVGDYTYIHLGLNPNTKGCSWQKISRDLESDLKRFEPNNAIKLVNAFLIRGSGRADNIELFSKEKNSTNLSSSCSLPRKTGQSNSYDAAGIMVSDGTEKDDGYYQKGTTPNFIRDDEKEIVTDMLTGLMWQDNEAVMVVRKRWLSEANYKTCLLPDDPAHLACFDTTGDTAASYCEGLSLGDYDDWRLPTVNELEEILDYGTSQPALDATFKNVASAEYWSSTPIRFALSIGNNFIAWVVNFNNGKVTSNYKYFSHNVRCVRGKK